MSVIFEGLLGPGEEGTIVALYRIGEVLPLIGTVVNIPSLPDYFFRVVEVKRSSVILDSYRSSKPFIKCREV